MLELIAANIAPIMFGSLVLFLLFGYPVAFALAANGLLYFFIGVELAPHSGGDISLSWNLLYALPERFWGGVLANETLLAVPFFTFMGIILERSGMAEDLLDTIGQLFGPIRGGLAYAVIFVGALLAATTGVVAASVIAMGLISLPIMLRYGYDRRVASGVIAASGTLAQIIPPSLVLIVLADQLGRSVGDMYEGALVPGLVLTGLYALFILIMSIVRPKWVPALPLEARTLGSGVTSLVVALIATGAIAYGSYQWLEPRYGDNARIWAMVVATIAIYLAAILDRGLKLKLMSHLTQQVIIVLIPPLALIFLVLGTIFLGIATPTEGGAMGAVGALVMSALKRRLTLESVEQALASTTRLSAFVLFILVGSRVFSLTFYGVNGHLWVEHLLTSVPGGEVGFLIVVNIIIFFLAFFLDFFELAFIIVPLLAPAAQKLGIDLIWFGVLLGVNMQTSFMHPPFGFSLFYLRSVAPKIPYIDKVTKKRTEPITTGQIYWGAIPFVLIQVVMMALVIAFPQTVTRYKTELPAVNPNTIKIQLPSLGGGLGLPPLGGNTGDQGDVPSGLGGALPTLNGPPPGLGGQQPAPAPAPSPAPSPDLSQPPKIQ